MTVTYQEEGEGEQRVENIKLLQITSTTIQVRTLLTPSFSCCAVAVLWFRYDLFRIRLRFF